MISEHPDCKTAAHQARLTFIDTGTGVARVRCYGTVRPADPTLAPGAPPLVELPLRDPCGTLAGGIITLAPGAPTLVLTSGSAVWARVVNGNGDTVFDCDVSGTSGTGELKLSATVLYEGGEVVLLSGVLG